MAKKLLNIEKAISEKADDFRLFFLSNLSSPIREFIFDLSHRTNVYLFSGIIRNFYLNNKTNDFRDIDLVIEDEVPLEIFYPHLQLKRNSFGGYKIIIDAVVLDIWVIESTWALNQGQLKLPLQLSYQIPNTTFFNFSSILYSINDNMFIIGKQFKRFLRDKKIDIVLTENPYPELCIVNSFYYSDTLQLKLSSRIVGYIKTNFEFYKSKLEPVQLKHFGEIKYPIDTLEQRVSQLY